MGMADRYYEPPQEVEMEGPYSFDGRPLEVGTRVRCRDDQTLGTVTEVGDPEDDHDEGWSWSVYVDVDWDDGSHDRLSAVIGHQSRWGFSAEIEEVVVEPSAIEKAHEMIEDEDLYEQVRRELNQLRQREEQLLRTLATVAQQARRIEDASLPGAQAEWQVKAAGRYVADSVQFAKKRLNQIGRVLT